MCVPSVYPQRQEDSVFPRSNYRQGAPRSQNPGTALRIQINIGPAQQPRSQNNHQLRLLSFTHLLEINLERHLFIYFPTSTLLLAVANSRVLVAQRWASQGKFLSTPGGSLRRNLSLIQPQARAAHLAEWLTATQHYQSRAVWDWVGNRNALLTTTH